MEIQIHLIKHGDLYFYGQGWARPKWSGDINKAKRYSLVGTAKAMITNIEAKHPKITGLRLASKVLQSDDFNVWSPGQTGTGHIKHLPKG